MASRRKDPKYIAILAIVAVLILVVGALVRPKSNNVEPGVSRTPGEIVRLERLTQRRSVEDMAEYFAHVASIVEDSVILLENSGQTGVIWESGHVITSARPGPFPESDKTALAGSEHELTRDAASPGLPYVLLTTPMDVIPSPRVPARFYSFGSWLLSVWRPPDGSLRYARGNLLGSAERRCGGLGVLEVLTNFPTAARYPGAGVFDLDGNLTAVVLSCDGELIAAEADALASEMRMDESLEARLIRRYGFRVDSASEPESTYTSRESAAIVREVWVGFQAHQAGLLPGDVLLSVDEHEVEQVADLEQLTLPVSREVRELVVWRAKRRLTVQLAARTMRAPESGTHGFLGDAAEGLPIEAVARDSLAARAGARAGDRLIAVNQVRPPSYEAVEQAIGRSADGPVHVVIERRGRMWGALVEPQ